MDNAATRARLLGKLAVLRGLADREAGQRRIGEAALHRKARAGRPGGRRAPSSSRSVRAMGMTPCGVGVQPPKASRPASECPAARRGAPGAAPPTAGGGAHAIVSRSRRCTSSRKPPCARTATGLSTAQHGLPACS